MSYFLFIDPDLRSRAPLTLIPTWISKYTHYNARGEITNPFPNFHGVTVEVWEWIRNFIPHFTGYVIIYPCQDPC